MNRSFITASILIVGLAALGTWIAMNTYWEEVTLPARMKGEAATNPFYSRQRLAEELGAVPERPETLATLPPPDGVIVLAHWHWGVIESRRRQIEEWVEAGGRLLVDYSLRGGEEEFKRWSGLSREVLTEEEIEEAEKADRRDRRARIPEQLREMLGNEAPCATLTAEPAAARAKYTICGVDEFTYLQSDRRPEWSLSVDGRMQAARIQVGAGSVTLLNAAPFGNRQLLEADHAQLFVDATQLRRGDRIYFVSEERQPSLLELMWAYGAPVIVLALLLLALALWRGAVRLGPLIAPPEPVRRSIAEQIRGTGQFALRFGGGRALHAAMVRALHEAARRRIPGYASLPVPDQIEAIARIAGIDSESLAMTINHSGARSATELRNAVMALELTRRKLLNATSAREVSNAS